MKHYHCKCSYFRYEEQKELSLHAYTYDALYRLASATGTYAGADSKNRSTSEKYSSMSKDKALPDFDSDQMDQLSWMFWTAAWLQDARRIAKPGAPVCLFIDWRQLPAMTLALQWAGWTWRGVAVWDKVASRPQKGRFRQQYFLMERS